MIMVPLVLFHLYLLTINFYYDHENVCLYLIVTSKMRKWLCTTKVILEYNNILRDRIFTMIFLMHKGWWSAMLFVEYLQWYTHENDCCNEHTCRQWHRGWWCHCQWHIHFELLQIATGNSSSILMATVTDLQYRLAILFRNHTRIIKQTFKGF